MSAAAPGLKARVALGYQKRATLAGRAPRRAYTHYWIEDEGLHSRLHLQNFWSTFWPDVDEPSTATIRAYRADGAPLGEHSVTVPRFGSIYLEVRDLLAAIGADATEGILAADLAPPDGVRRRFDVLPSPETVEINTPFWMAYYDDAENYMYVHSIEKLGGEVFGAPAPLRWHLSRADAHGEEWRSWRLIDRPGLSELHVVVINNGQAERTTEVGVHTADGERLWSQPVTLAPRALERVRVPCSQLAAVAHIRVGVDPLPTGNGKPYVLMRYGDGPLSLHHG